MTKTEAQRLLDYGNDRRVQLSATIINWLSVFCYVASVYNIFQVVRGGLFIGASFPAIFYALLNVLIIINLFILGVFGGRYSSSLRNLLPMSNDRIGPHTKHFLNLWITIACLAVLKVVQDFGFSLMLRLGG